MDDSQIINLYFARDENAIIETKKSNIRICVIGLHRIFCITGKTPRSV